MKAWRIVKQVVIWSISLVVLVLVVAYLSGWFVPKVSPDETGTATTRPRATPLPADAKIVEVVARDVPQTVATVGTVQAIDETSVGSRIMAQVKEVRVTPGRKVKAGEVLITLDQTDLQARLSQATAQLEATKAHLRQAGSDVEKLTTLRTQGAATARELDDARRAMDVATANIRVQEQAIAEAQSQLEFATITSPIDGTVIDHYVKPGDLARPGQTLVKLEGQLQLVASVPERLAVRLKLGDVVGVNIDAINLQCQAGIAEIVPEASPLSRAMVIKVRGPCPPGVYSGMFGRMIIPQGQEQRLMVPTAAVRTVGQLSMVMVAVKEGDQWFAQRRMVRTGLTNEDMIEIQSGLSAGEHVLAEYPAAF